MLDPKQSGELQESPLQLWLQLWQNWQCWLPNEQMHGLNKDQRETVDEIAEQHVQMLQQALNLVLQYVSLNAEVAELYMAFVHKSIGIKAS